MAYSTRRSPGRSGLVEILPLALLVAALPPLLSGCPETRGCPEGEGFRLGPDGKVLTGECEPIPDASVDTSDSGQDDTDAGACGGCPAGELCRSDGECVACLSAEDCEGELSCDPAGACVQCVEDAQCGEDAPICEEGSCVPCTSNDQCEALGAALCQAGACVACTPATEAEHCGDQACDPVTFQCTGVDRGTVTSCKSCSADSECAEGNRCIELTYADGSGGFYCMPLPDGGCVTRPYGFLMSERASRSGEAATVYCGIKEELTNCEAVLAAVAAEGLGCDEDSACPAGGRCEVIDTAGTSRCTYSCDDPPQCPSALAACPNEADSYCQTPPE